MAEMVKNRKLIVLLYIFIILIIILGVMNSCLYIHNNSFQKENRELIIKNDSILSININLNEELQKYRQGNYSRK